MLNFHHRKLSNGLTVIAETNSAAHTSAVGFFVKAGTRDEEKPLMGVSHFLEHMMFKGSARRTADDVNREFDEIGANYNAYTSQETTVYYAQVLPEFLPRAIDLLGDMLRPALRSEDFLMEKNVILEEIGMYEDRPQWRLQDTLMETHFGEHPLAYRVLGTSDSIKALTRDQMERYFQTRYSPDNIVVAAAGKVDFEKFVDDVSKVAGSWTPTGAKRSYSDPCCDTHIKVIADTKVKRQYLAMICPGPSAQDLRRYAAKVLSDVVGDSEGSRLYWALVDPGLADEADFYFGPQDCCGIYLASATCDPERVEQVEKILLETIDNYVNSIDSAEIERAKNKLATQATLEGENPAGRMRGLGSQWTYLGEYLPLAEELQRIKAVSEADIKALIADWPFKPRTVVRLGPK
ncbi:MAG: insulinase family protein [Phycisphaeraceae bacterium]|nr:insulinase family protein [Phycisphaeraceae bacterium]